MALVLERGALGGIYNIAASEERTNLDLTKRVLELLDRPVDLIRHVTDRPGHDRRYSIAAGRLRELGWEPRWRLDEGLAHTVRWYQDHPEWWRPLKSGEYLSTTSASTGSGSRIRPKDRALSRVAIVGAGGQLGAELVHAYRAVGDDVLPLARPQVDLEQPASLEVVVLAG